MTTFDFTRHPPKANNYPGNVVSFWENSLLRELCDKCGVWMDALVRKMLAVLSIITPHSALRIQAWCACDCSNGATYCITAGVLCFLKSPSSSITRSFCMTAVVLSLHTSFSCSQLSHSIPCAFYRDYYSASDVLKKIQKNPTPFSNPHAQHCIKNEKGKNIIIL